MLSKPLGCFFYLLAYDIAFKLSFENLPTHFLLKVGRETWVYVIRPTAAHIRIGWLIQCCHNIALAKNTKQSNKLGQKQ